MGYTRGGAPLYGRLLLALARSLRLQPREYLTTRPLREAGAEADAATVDPAAALAQCLAKVDIHACRFCFWCSFCPFGSC